MTKIEYKIQVLIEKKRFDQLTPAEREMVYSVMTEEEYTERYALLSQVQSLFEEERELLTPDAAILSSLKNTLTASDIPREENEGKTGFAWLGYKVSIFKSAAAALLLLLGSYFVFGNAKPRIEYIEKEVVVEKKIYDTVYTERIVEMPIEKIVEVPVEKIVKVVKYQQLPPKENKKKANVSFVMREMETTQPSKKVELEGLKKSYGNSKINKEDLEQFRVSL